MNSQLKHHLQLLGVIIYFTSCDLQVKNEKTYYLENGEKGCSAFVIKKNIDGNIYLIGCADSREAPLEGRFLEIVEADTAIGYCEYMHGYQKKSGVISGGNWFVDLVRLDQSKKSNPEWLQVIDGSIQPNSKYLNIYKEHDNFVIDPIGFDQDSIAVGLKNQFLFGTKSDRIEIASNFVIDSMSSNPLEIYLVLSKLGNGSHKSIVYEISQDRIIFSAQLQSLSDSVSQPHTFDHYLHPHLDKELKLSVLNVN